MARLKDVWNGLRKASYASFRPRRTFFDAIRGARKNKSLVSIVTFQFTMLFSAAPLILYSLSKVDERRIPSSNDIFLLQIISLNLLLVLGLLFFRIPHILFTYFFQREISEFRRKILIELRFRYDFNFILFFSIASAVLFGFLPTIMFNLRDSVCPEILVYQEKRQFFEEFAIVVNPDRLKIALFGIEENAGYFCVSVVYLLVIGSELAFILCCMMIFWNIILFHVQAGRIYRTNAISAFLLESSIYVSVIFILVHLILVLSIAGWQLRQYFGH